MSLKSLLDKKKEPTIEDVKEAIAGNYCRCGAYPNIFNAAIEAARAKAQSEASKEPELKYVPAEISVTK